MPGFRLFRRTVVPTPDAPRHTDSAMPGSSVTPRPPLPGSNRFPPGHPMNPYPVQRNSGNPSSRASGSFSLISSLSKIHLDLPLSTSSGGGVPACSRTIYGPKEVRDNFHRNLKEDEVKRVLAKIEMIYREVELDSDELESGYCCCLGLLNPKANIRVNGSIFNSNGLLNPKANIRVNDSIFNSDASSPGKGGDMAQRSLDGLITFLTCLFPYLPVAEALAYLDAVDADPLAAAALIITKRGRNYCWNYYWMNPTIAAATMEMALKCGAVAAQHPDPSLLVKGWTSLSPYLHQIALPLSVPCPDYNTWSFILRNLRNEYCNLEVQAAWELADDRLHAKLRFSDDGGLPTGLPPVRAAMKRVLLAKIHGFYLKALCSLPKDELTQRYHRALVMGGYCYGPLQPAANIIVNMIWYEQTFPTTKRLKKITLISTGFLWRVAARSLYGLISFLCTRYPSLTPDHAVQRLLVAEANLQVADPNLFETPSNLEMDWSWCPQIGSGKGTASIQMKAVRKASASVLEAYTAAATAAFHPSPPAQKEFLGSPDSVEKLKNASYMVCLDNGHQLSNEEFGLLFMFLQKCCLSSVGTLDHQQEPEPTVVGKSEYAEISRRVHSFWGLHDRVSSMVNAALEKFNRTHESQYSLHIICGVNELVSGPKFCNNFLAHLPFKYQHYHINFLATLDAQPPKLFFAECNLDDHNDTWCVPVDWSPPVGGQARCFYCESHGYRIIHPALSFHGFDFEDAFFGPDNKEFYDNDQIIFFKSAFMEWVNGVEEDAIYISYRLRGDDGDGDSKRLRL
ncbi:uncharacterized protein [Miscanthus floridulus]|uniref:uncharacterized protein n=1 Tax=Miscanthus floridulus TaxID=154761 RepID=UPI00345B4B38